MPDRLEELRRQRTLVQQHLDWLDREIANTAPPPSAPAQSAPQFDPVPKAAAMPAAAIRSAAAPLAPATPDPDSILAQYRTEPTSLKSDVRQGCLLYFVAALALLALGVLALYYLLSRR
jgi:hypothetical protein